VLIPQKGPLPLFQPFIDLGKSTGTSGLIDPLVALLNPVTKLLVDLGYDRVSNPGIPRNLSILPFNPLTFNPIDFAVKFVAAIFQGIHDAINVIVNPAATAVAPNTTSTLVSRTFLQQETEPDKELDEKTNLDGQTNPIAMNNETNHVDALAKGLQDQGTIDQAAADKVAAEKAAADKLAADQLAANQAAAEKAAADQLAADKVAAEKEAAEQAAAQQEAADQAAAAAKAAAEKEAADKSVADKLVADKLAADREAEKQAAAAKAKEAQDAAEKARNAAAQDAADKAKEAAEKAKDIAAANNGTTKQVGADPEKTDPADGNADGAGETEKKAA
jgi:hypothetical protein